MTLTDGSASSNQPGNDFNMVSSTVQFSKDESIQTVHITIVKDGLYEEEETFRVALRHDRSGLIGEPAVATVTIKNNDRKW